jgi:hypothetical protein
MRETTNGKRSWLATITESLPLYGLKFHSRRIYPRTRRRHSFRLERRRDHCKVAARVQRETSFKRLPITSRFPQGSEKAEFQTPFDHTKV